MPNAYLCKTSKPSRMSIFGWEVSASRCLLPVHLSSVVPASVVLQALFSYLSGPWLSPLNSICWDVLGLYGVLISLTVCISVFQQLCSPEHERTLSRALYAACSKLTRPLRWPGIFSSPVLL